MASISRQASAGCARDASGPSVACLRAQRRDGPWREPCADRRRESSGRGPTQSSSRHHIRLWECCLRTRDIRRDDLRSARRAASRQGSDSGHASLPSFLGRHRARALNRNVRGARRASAPRTRLASLWRLLVWARACGQSRASSYIREAPFSELLFVPASCALPRSCHSYGAESESFISQYFNARLALAAQGELSSCSRYFRHQDAASACCSSRWRKSPMLNIASAKSGSASSTRRKQSTASLVRFCSSSTSARLYQANA